jgi:hypothetical protein
MLFVAPTPIFIRILSGTGGVKKLVSVRRERRPLTPSTIILRADIVRLLWSARSVEDSSNRKCRETETSMDERTEDKKVAIFLVSMSEGCLNKVLTARLCNLLLVGGLSCWNHTLGAQLSRLYSNCASISCSIAVILELTFSCRSFKRSRPFDTHMLARIFVLPVCASNRAYHFEVIFLYFFWCISSGAVVLGLLF